MGSTSLKTLLAIVLLLMCVPLGTGHLRFDRPTDAIEEPTAGPVLGRDFKLKYGQELTVKGQNLKVKFESLLEDSRCPKDVKCIWEGDAKLVISVRRGNAKESKIELHTSGNFAQTGKYNQYVIKLVALDPYPRTSVQEKRRAYLATLLITKE